MYIYKVDLDCQKQIIIDRYTTLGKRGHSCFVAIQENHQIGYQTIFYTFFQMMSVLQKQYLFFSPFTFTISFHLRKTSLQLNIRSIMILTLFILHFRDICFLIHFKKSASNCCQSKIWVTDE